MGLSFNNYLEKENDEYIKNFFIVLNILLKSTIEIQRIVIDGSRKLKFLEEDIVFLLKSMTSHYHFTEKHKEKLQSGLEIPKMFSFSSETKEGLVALWNYLDEILEAYNPSNP